MSTVVISSDIDYILYLNSRILSVEGRLHWSNYPLGCIYLRIHKTPEMYHSNVDEGDRDYPRCVSSNLFN